MLSNLLIQPCHRRIATAPPVSLSQDHLNYLSFQLYCFDTEDSDMTAIGSLVFCTDCGDLLDGSTGDKKAILVCDVCGAHNEGTTAT